MNYAKRELKRVKNKITPLLEPFAIVALLGLFVVPALVLSNLTPVAVSQKSNTNNPNVLGLEDKPGNTGIVMVGGTHNIITNERFEAQVDGSSTYATTLKARAAGTYSKPIIQIDNPSGHDVSVNFKSYSSSSLYSEISLRYNDKLVSLLSSEGADNAGQVMVEAGKTVTVYLEITNTLPISFDQNLQIDLKAN